MPLFKIFAALTDDVNQGWVRLGDFGLPHRSIVRLSVRATSKHVYCEVLTLDDNFIGDYNAESKTIKIKEPKSTLVISEWYRKKLGDLKKQSEYEIDVTSTNHLCGKIRACLSHPQVVVRITTWLSL